MFIRITSTKNSPRKSVKVVESVREGYKVKQVMLLHVGIAADESEIDKLKQLGQAFIAEEQLRREKDSPQASLFDAETMKDRLETLKKSMVYKKPGRKSRHPKRQDALNPTWLRRTSCGKEKLPGRNRRKEKAKQTRV